jgi:hypothetical protein
MPTAEGYHETTASGHGDPSFLSDHPGSLTGHGISICQYSDLQRELPMQPMGAFKFEFRNPKLETNSKSKYPNVQNRSSGPWFWSLAFESLDIVSNFVLRISCFSLFCLFLDMPSKLEAHRGQNLVREVRFASRTESLIKRRG